MNILPTIGDFFFRDKHVEIVCATTTETLKIEEKLKQTKSVDKIFHIRVKNEIDENHYHRCSIGSSNVIKKNNRRRHTRR